MPRLFLDNEVVLVNGRPYRIAEGRNRGSGWEYTLTNQAGHDVYVAGTRFVEQSLLIPDTSNPQRLPDDPLLEYEYPEKETSTSGASETFQGPDPEKETSRSGTSETFRGPDSETRLPDVDARVEGEKFEDSLRMAFSISEETEYEAATALAPYDLPKEEKPEIRTESPEEHHEPPFSNDKPLTHKYVVQWQGAEYLRQEFTIDESLDNILILCGRGRDLKCANCEEYAGQNGHDKVRPILRLLESVHRSPPGQTVYQRVGERTESVVWFHLQGTWYQASPKQLEDFRVLEIITITNWKGLDDVVKDILQRLAAALRPAAGSLFWSEAEANREGETTHITLKPLEPTLTQGCWQPLFPSKVIAKYHVENGHKPLSETVDELELDFNIMLELCGADFPIEVDGGLCLSGAYTLLIPVKAVSGFDGRNVCLIWHLLRVDSTEQTPSKARRELWQEWARWSEKGQTEWYKAKNIESLTNFERHALGWTKSSTITLGTATQPYSLRRSSAAVTDSETVETTFNMAMSVGYGGWGLSLMKSIKQGRTERNRIQDRDKNLVDWLEESTEEQILLYNPEQRQAWLVPKISVILHLVLERMRYVITRHDYQGLELPYLEEDTVDPLVIFRMLESKLEEPFPHRPRDDRKLKDALRSVLYMLDQVERFNIAPRANRRFFGYEAYDIIHQIAYFRLKEANISNHLFAFGMLGGWVKLLEEIPIVLFFKGISDPIKPKSSESGSHGRNDTEKMVSGENYLAATIPSLCALASRFRAERFDCAQLAREGFWHCEKLFGRCNAQAHHSQNSHFCNELQAVWPKDTAIPPSPDQLEEHQHGAVVFGPGTGLSEYFHHVLR